MLVTRRTSLASAMIGGLATTFIPNNPAYSITNNDNTPQTTPASVNDEISTPTIPSLTIPLQYQPTLSAYTISYKVGNSQFGAIIDTGSPFLLVPQSSEASCRPEYRWGCFRPGESQPAAGLAPTLERFDGNEGLVEWREGKFSFDMAMDDENERNSMKDPSLSLPSTALAANAAPMAQEDVPNNLSNVLFPRSLMTFGVISESLMDGPGGIFLGLVKNTNGWIRPSFLGQSNVSAFSVDLRDREGTDKTLALYGTAAADTAIKTAVEQPRTRSLSSSKKKTDTASTSLNGMLNTPNAIPLVRDLNKKYGDPTIHYVGVASTITANGSNLASTSSSRRNSKIYCIFDTGCSGMSISPSLYDERYNMARAQKEKSLWGTVEVELKTISGETVTLKAKRPITTPLGSERPWGKKLDGHLIVLGLSFLEGMKMTVDIDGDKIWFED